MSDCGACAPELNSASVAAVAPVVTGWTRDAGPPAVTRLTTATDQVAMGTATPVAGRKVTVLTTGVNQGIRFTATAAADNVLDANVLADLNVRLALTMAAISWGDGVAAPDTTLGRGGVDLLEVALGDTFRIVGGGLRTGLTIVTVAMLPYVVLPTDLILIVLAAGTISLPALGAAGANRHLFIKRAFAGGGVVVIDPSGAELIDGAPTIPLGGPFAAAHIYGDPTTPSWWTIA